MDEHSQQLPRSASSTSSDQGGRTTAATSAAGGPTSLPLKRGSACQYCRRRKLRCSGKMPDSASCEGCLKTNRECFFDEPAKPKTKIMRLEAKIASLESMLSSSSTRGPVQPSAGRTTSSTPYAGRPPHVLSTNGDSSAEPSSASGMASSSNVGQAFHPYLQPAHEKPPSRRQVLEQQSFSTALEELFSSEPAGSQSLGPSAPGWSFDSPTVLGGPGDHQPFDFSPTVDLAYGQSMQMSPQTMPTVGMQPSTTAALPLGLDGLDHFQGITDMPTPPMQSLPGGSGTEWQDPAYAAYATFAPYVTPQASHLMPPPMSLGIAPPVIQQHSHESLPSQRQQPQMQQQQGVDTVNHRTVNSPATSATPPQGLGSLFDPMIPIKPLPKSFLSTFQSSAALPGQAAQPPGGRLEVPRDIRDSLLSLFWMRRRQFGCVLHPRFFDRLDLASTNHTVRSLEPTLFNECRRLIDKGLEDEDEHGMLNIIQASTILTIFFFSQGRYPEGWTQSGISMRLAIGAQLHRIRPPFLPSSANAARYKVRRPQERGGGTRRRVGSMMPPPVDMIDVGERIWAFWLAVIADKSISTANCWPSALADHEIETPFPRPIGEYTEDFDGSNDTTIAELFRPPTPNSIERRAQSLSGCIAASLLLLHQASRLFDRPLDDEEDAVQPEPYTGTDTGGAAPGSRIFHRQSNTDDASLAPASLSASPAQDAAILRRASSGSSKASGSDPAPLPLPLPLPPTRPIPAECIELETRLKQFIATIPLAYRDPGRRVPGGIPPWDQETNHPHDLGDWEVERPDLAGKRVGVNPVVILLHTQVFVSLLLTYEEQARYDPSLWPKTVAAAKSVVQLIQLIANVDFAKLDIFLVCCWRFASNTLLAEAKRQKRVGNAEASASATVEVEVLVLAMQRIGQVFTIGDSFANYVKNLQTLNISDTATPPDEPAFGTSGDLSEEQEQYCWSAPTGPRPSPAPPSQERGDS